MNTPPAYCLLLPAGRTGRTPSRPLAPGSEHRHLPLPANDTGARADARAEPGPLRARAAQTLEGSSRRLCLHPASEQSTARCAALVPALLVCESLLCTACFARRCNNLSALDAWTRFHSILPTPTLSTLLHSEPSALPCSCSPSFRCSIARLDFRHTVPLLHPKATHARQASLPPR